VARPGGGWAEVDRTGRVLADVTAPPTDLVHLDVPSAPGAPGSQLAAADHAGVLVAATLPRAFSGQVASVTAGTDGKVHLTLAIPVSVDLGDTSQLHAKYGDVAALLAGATLHNGDVIDVTVPQSPTVTST
jgi:hypothetical protein